MRTILLSILFLSFTLVGIGQNSINCLPDKGIKTAKTFGKFEEDNIDNPYENHYRLVKYDKKGRPILINESREKIEHRLKYRNGKLQLVITKRKDLPNSYSVDELDSLIENVGEVIDTTFVTRHYLNGEVAEIVRPNGEVHLFEYEGCNVETQSILTSSSDTIQFYQFFFENGVLVKKIWTPHKPTDQVIKEYYDYEFNKHGHWIRRKHKTWEGTAVEWRELRYY